MLPSQLQAFQDEKHLPFLWDAETGIEVGYPSTAALLVHGYPGTPAEMRSTARLLTANGIAARGMLLPGFGPQIETLAERTVSDWASAVERELRELRITYQQVYIVGHSLGAALAMQVAAHNVSPPDGLILFAPFWKIDHIAWTTLPVIRLFFPNPRIFRWIKLDFNSPDVRDGIHNFMPDADLNDPEVQQAIRDFKMPVSMFAQIHRAGQLAYQNAPKIRIKTLVIQGKGDPLVKPHHTRELVRRFNSDLTYYEIDGEHDIIDPERSDWPALTSALQTFVRQAQPAVNS